MFWYVCQAFFRTYIRKFSRPFQTKTQPSQTLPYRKGGPPRPADLGISRWTNVAATKALPRRSPLRGFAHFGVWNAFRYWRAFSTSKRRFLRKCAHRRERGRLPYCDMYEISYIFRRKWLESRNIFDFSYRFADIVTPEHKCIRFFIHIKQICSHGAPLYMIFRIDSCPTILAHTTPSQTFATYLLLPDLLACLVTWFLFSYLLASMILTRFYLVPCIVTFHVLLSCFHGFT